MSQLPAFLAALSVVALSACGTANTSDSDNKNSDTTGPSFQKVTPSNNTQVSEDLQQIVVSFNEPVDAATLALANSITITPSVDLSVALDETDPKQVVITLKSPLAIDTTYKVSIGTALTDAAGNSIPNLISLSYHTRKPYTVGGTVTGLNGTLVLKELKYPSEHPELDDEGNVLLDDNKKPVLPPAPSVTITADGNFTFSSAYFPSDTFEVAIDSVTLDEGSCAVESAAGTVGTQNVTSVKIICDRVETFYGQDYSWNVYETKNKLYNTTSTELVNLGELRKLTLPGMTSCDGLTASDELDVFKWRCVIDKGVLFVHSYGLKPGKGLSNLIDFDNLSWKKNKVNVYDHDNVRVDGSNSAIWWTDKIIDVASVPSALSFGPVYVVKTNPLKSIQINEDQVSLVVEPAIKMTTPKTTSPLIDFASIIVRGNYAWIEGKIDASNVDYGIYIKGTSDGTYTGGTTLRNIQISNAKNTGVHIEYHIPRSIHDVTTKDNTADGILLTGNSVHENAEFSINPELDRITAISNGRDGLRIEALNYSVNDVISANNGGNGVTVTGANNTLSNLSVYSNQGSGIALDGANNSFTTAHASFNDAGLSVTTNADSNTTDGLSLILNNVGISDTSTNKNTVLNNLVQVHNGSSDVSAGVVGEGTDLTQVYAGPADMDSGYISLNGNTYNPSNDYTPNIINFEARLQDHLRAWGPADGTATPCTGPTNCLIYDWTPVADGPLAP